MSDTATAPIPVTTVADPGPRPARRPAGIRSGEVINQPSVSLHPGNIEGHDDEDLRAYVADAHTAMDTLHQAVTKVIDARVASQTNPTWTEARQVIEVGMFAEKVTTQAAKIVDSTLAALQKRIAHTQGELTKPLAAGASTAIAGELRALARSMSEADRQALVKSFIDKGDTVSLGALIGSGVPPVLSGLSDKAVEAYTAMHNRKTNPLATKRLEAMQKAYDKLSDAGSLLLTQMEAAQGVKPNVVAKLRAQQSAAEMKFR